MASTAKEEPHYDHDDFNTRAGISNQPSHSSNSSTHSGSFRKPFIKNQESTNEHNTDSYENKAYTFDEVPLGSPPSTQGVTFNETVKDVTTDEPEKMKITVEKIERQKSINVEAEKRSIIKNVIVICIAFMLLFTAFQSMSALQSSINNVDGLGTWSNTAVYASLVVSCMFLPSFFIKNLTVKWTLPICMFCYTIYICTQFYPEFYTIIPGAIFVGIGAAPMWSAKCTYLTMVGERYANLISVDVEPIIVRFFGIFFLFFQSSSVWGNLISSLVLRDDNDKNKTATDVSVCGTNFCPDTELPADNFEISDSKLYTLAGIYLGCSVLAWIFVALFLDPLSRYGESDRTDSSGTRKEDKSNLTLLVATFQHMTKPYQMLIIPLTIWSGVEQGFFLSDYTAGFITCIYGVDQVGWVLITYGVCDAICSISFGVIIKYTGRPIIYVLGAVINLTVILTLLTWDLTDKVLDQQYIFFILAGMWGVSDAVWQTQINALYGVLFANDEEAAYSNYRLWESAGFILAFILQTQVCIDVKLYVLLAVITAGMIGYFLIEINERKTKKL